MSKKELIDYWKKSSLVKDESVLKAFLKIDRENFILPEYISQAYDDNPLPIPGGQTISQPTTVVLMLQALELRPGLKILEIGAGSGYNAALLGEITGENGKVFSIERIPELADFARKNLKKEGIKNVEVLLYTGAIGCKSEAPFDRIIVTAAAKEIPKELINQLREDGILLIPIGPPHCQRMIKIKKQKGKILQEDLGSFIFVPLVQ